MLFRIYYPNLRILCNEIPELKNAITGSLQEKGIAIPSRPNSEKICK